MLVLSFPNTYQHGMRLHIGINHIYHTGGTLCAFYQAVQYFFSKCFLLKIMIPIDTEPNRFLMKSEVVVTLFDQQPPSDIFFILHSPVYVHEYFKHFPTQLIFNENQTKKTSLQSPSRVTLQRHNLRICHIEISTS